MKMKRRIFGLLAGTSLATFKLGKLSAKAADASLLNTTLMPLGGERAGNADGSIPAWTGGVNAPPAGWDPTVVPALFADDQPLFVVDSSNMAQHAEFLSVGTKELITKYGFSLKVYPTHRTAAAPQWVYDNTATNASTASLLPAGGRFGFTNAFGGIPFPIPDTSDPLAAGSQVVWNAFVHWRYTGIKFRDYAYVVSGGSATLTSTSVLRYSYPFFGAEGVTRETINNIGVLYRAVVYTDNPPNQAGSVDLSYEKIDQPAESWEVLAGQGRVRKAPQVAYDTPSISTDGNINYDEYLGWTGDQDRYDCKFVGKKEMYIPYNNNALFLKDPADVLKTHFPDPDVIRWEKHRVWVTEMTLHPGERNVMARRTMYSDEDTWIPSLVDCYDAGGNLFHVNHTYNYVRPDVPSVGAANNCVWNLQTDDYCMPSGPWNQGTHYTQTFLPQGGTYPPGTFDPQNIAASSQY